MYNLEPSGVVFSKHWCDNLDSMCFGVRSRIGHDLIVIPSIYSSSVVTKQLESIGLADPKEAAKIPQNIYWLGVGTAVFTTGNMVLGALLSGF